MSESGKDAVDVCHNVKIEYRIVVSKPQDFLRALEDALYNFTRPVKTFRVELPNSSKQAPWQQRTPAMAAGLTDHLWTLRELLTTLLVPQPMNI